MKLLINTQYMENYGAHAWDGQGECPQHWKPKGGQDYFLPLDGFNPGHEFAEKRLQMIVDGIRDKVEWSDNCSRQYIIDYTIVDDDYLTDFERDQLESDGYVSFPTKVLQESAI